MPGRQTTKNGRRPIAVREVTELDREWGNLTELFLEFEGYNQAFEARELAPDWNERWKQRLHLHDDRLVLLAWTAKKLAGCIIAVIRRNDGLANDTYGYLSYLYVREAFRRNGIGAALLDRAEAWCRERGAQRVELDVFEKNQLGRQFWSGAGFETYSRTMRKTLEDRR